MTRPIDRSVVALEAPLLGLLAGWVSLCSWSGMVERPQGFLAPTLGLGALVVLLGHTLRRWTPFPAYAVAGAQLSLALLGLNVVVAGAQSRFVVLPTAGSVREVVHAVYNGAATLNYYSAPVSVNHGDTAATLLAAGLGVLLVIDLLLTWWRRPPVVALPLLATLSVPVSILRESLALPVFVGCALLFVRLLGVPEPARHDSTARIPSAGESPGEVRRGVLWGVAVTAVLLALLVAPAIPVANLWARGPADEATSASQGGGSFSVTSVNPFIKLRRDLVERTHTPMVTARTKAPRTSYLRTTVLDEFTTTGWGASTRNLPAANTANGRFPVPPGLGPYSGGREDRWALELAPDFFTSWLPIPYPIRSLRVEGSWRYDARTLDVKMVGPVATSGLTYSAVAFTPDLDARALARTVSAPSKVQVPNTQVPKDLPSAITQQAEKITHGTSSNFERAVALQEWFRSTGNFRYSVKQRPGSGMDLLAHFVTDDRVGYCEQYAAAMAAMGRTLGIPSRVVVGFLDGTSQSAGRVLYTSDDRHAWPEMYFSGVGWVRFEPTPAQRSGASPPWTRMDLSGSASGPAPGTRQTPRTRRPLDTPTPAKQDSASVPWAPVAGLAVLGLLAALPVVLRTGQRRRRLASRDPITLSEGAWAELRATALDLGVSWRDDRSPREQAATLASEVPAARRRMESSVEELLVEVEQGRYGPPRENGTRITEEVRLHTTQRLAGVRAALLEGTRRQRSWWNRLWPVSVWHPRRSR